MQKSEIADSVSLLTGCTAIFDFYTAKAVHEQVAKRIANAAWRFLVILCIACFLCYKGEKLDEIYTFSQFEKYNRHCKLL